MSNPEPPAPPVPGAQRHGPRAWPPDHLSPSSLSLLGDCSRAWEARYRYDRPEPRSGPLILGSAFDAACEWALHRQWVGEWTTIEQLCLAFGRFWERELARPEVVDWGHKQASIVYQDGFNLASAPATIATLRGMKLAPHPDNPDEPALQVRIELTIPGVSVPIVGYIDAIERTDQGGLHAIDFKTAGRRWPKGKERKELQARIYTAALWQAGNPFSSLSFSYWVFVPGMTPEACGVQRLPCGLTEQDILLTLDMLRRSWRQVQSGAFPGNPHSYRCNAGCSEWERCGFG